MSRKARYVFDTSVLVSALIFERSKPGRVFRQALKSGRLLLSLPVLEELSEVLSRPKFERYVTAEEREEFLEALIERASFVEPEASIRVCRDPKDEKTVLKSDRFPLNGSFGGNLFHACVIKDGS